MTAGCEVLSELVDLPTGESDRLSDPTRTVQDGTPFRIEIPNFDGPAPAAVVDTINKFAGQRGVRHGN